MESGAHAQSALSTPEKKKRYTPRPAPPLKPPQETMRAANWQRGLDAIAKVCLCER